jgi:ATP/ADP translocase
MMPLIMLSILIPMSLEPLDKNGPSLTLVAAAFCTMKILEYSLRGVSNEMLFATLDYESRYVAKQEIALVANRLAKSGTAAALSWLTASNTTSISWIANVIAAMWCAASISLSQMNQIKRPKEKEI